MNQTSLMRLNNKEKGLVLRGLTKEQKMNIVIRAILFDRQKDLANDDPMVTWSQPAESIQSDYEDYKNYEDSEDRPSSYGGGQGPQSDGGHLCDTVFCISGHAINLFGTEEQREALRTSSLANAGEIGQKILGLPDQNLFHTLYWPQAIRDKYVYAEVIQGKYDAMMDAVKAYQEDHTQFGEEARRRERNRR